MAEENDTQSETPLFNTEKLNQILSFYKFPLVLSGIGLVLLIFAISLLVKTQTTSEVVFTSESTSSAKIKIRVDVAGAVISPGVYEMEEGSRIADVLVLAGGLSAAADRDWVAKNLNRAAKLTDGGKIYIPSVREVASGKTQTNLSDLSNPGNLLGVTSNLVNLNTASKAELEALPGIGPVTAGKIISGRPYQAVEELKSRKILGPSLFEKLKDLLTVY